MGASLIEVEIQEKSGPQEEDDGCVMRCLGDVQVDPEFRRVLGYWHGDGN